jgi:tetratricopeptide (TPR) repeat protein
MSKQLIEAEADSLEEAKKQVRSQVPEDCVVFSETVLSDGSPKTVKATADTIDAAFGEAQGKLPQQATVVEKRQVTMPATSVIPIQAMDDHEALGLARRNLGDTATVKGVILTKPGKKGFLGLGKTLNAYETQVFQPAVVEIIYRTKAKVRAEVLLISELEAQAPQYLARKKDAQFDQIIDELTVFLPKLPRNSELRKILSSTYLDRGAAKYQLGNQRQAIADWESAVRVDEGNWKALVNLSTLYMSDQRWTEAAQALEKAFQINSELNNNPRTVERLEQIRAHL